MEAVCKYTRLIRKLHTLKEFAEREEDRTWAQYLLGLDKYKIIDQYPVIYAREKSAPRLTKYGKERDTITEFIARNAYRCSANLIKEKLTLQVREWASEQTPMMFETLTLSSDNLRLSSVRKHLRAYKRRLREEECPYMIVFERGTNNGRPHFHVLFKASPRYGLASPGRWEGGMSHIERVCYLDDGYSNQQKMQQKGWTIESVVGYMTKYLIKDAHLEKDIDLFNYRTSTSRGFGLCKMRKKLKQEDSSRLEKMIKSRLPNYMTYLLKEVEMEWLRRYPPSTEEIQRTLVSLTAGPIYEIVKGRKVITTDLGVGTRARFKGYDDYFALTE